MKNNLKKILIQLLIISFLMNLLLFSKECIALASNGLLIWYRNMIPTLFPFMVLSGFLVRSGLADRVSIILKPFLGILFRLPSYMLYTIFMGFLCGFPMGAKVVADMLEQGKITEKQGEYLLTFCNNIGPLYMLGYVIPLFGWGNVWKILVLMYGVPLMYGFILRYCSSYKKIFVKQYKNSGNTYFMNHLHSLLYPRTDITLKASSYTRQNTLKYKSSAKESLYIQNFQSSLQNAIEQITLLGGCMIFFNCLQIYPKILSTYLPTSIRSLFASTLLGPLCCLLEIGGGLSYIAEQTNSLLTVSNKLEISLILSFLTFGGLSCIAQTCFILKDTNLRIGTYVKHKIIQSVLVLIIAYIWVN